MPGGTKPTVLSLAADLAAGRISSRELVERALARIADPAGEGARSFIKVYAGSAREAADAQDKLRRAGYVASPLAGLPVSIKDLFDVAGEVSLAASKALDDAPPATRDAPASIAPVITRVNKARREHPALQRTHNITFHPTDNDRLICFSKRAVGDLVLVVVNLDPDYEQAGFVDLDIDALGVDANHQFQVHDLLTDRRYLWQGSRNYVQLDPAGIPAHLFEVRRRVPSERSYDHFI